MGHPTLRWLTILCLAAAAIASCAGDRTRERILVRGSDSEVNLVQRMAEAFMARHPGVSISVTGGGSGTDIAALIGRSAHVANSSRPLKPIEKLVKLTHDFEDDAFEGDGFESDGDFGDDGEWDHAEYEAAYELERGEWRGLTDSPRPPPFRAWSLWRGSGTLRRGGQGAGRPRRTDCRQPRRRRTAGAGEPGPHPGRSGSGRRCSAGRGR